MNRPSRSSNECEVWIGVEVQAGEAFTTVCTLFARLEFGFRPAIGEGLSFYAPKGSPETFNVAMVWGPMPSSAVSTEVEEVSHYRGPMSESSEFMTALRCRALRVPSRSDAQAVVRYLTTHHGFELDPYGINTLEAPASEA
jgi:hypothetical protein